MPGLNNPDSYEDFDVEAAASDVADSLFPSKEESPGEELSPNGAEGAPVEVRNSETPNPQPTNAPGPSVVPGQNSVVKALPKSWKKEMAPHWEKLSPEVHDYVYAREADVMRGIQQYQQGAQSWNNLVQPFAPLLQQHPDVNPIQLMQGLMNSHLQLLNPSASNEAKLSLAKKLLEEYGISLDGVQSTPADETLKRELLSLRSELSQLKQGFTAREQQVYDSGLKEKERLVADFAKTHDFFDEVGADIFRFIQTGVATDLESAYEMAIWANPVVRAKMIAKQQSPQTPNNVKQPQGKKTFPNLDGEPSTAPRTRKSPSIDSTIDSIVASHYSKH